jgi:hypothetical protein
MKLLAWVLNFTPGYAVEKLISAVIHIVDVFSASGTICPVLCTISMAMAVTFTGTLFFTGPFWLALLSSIDINAAVISFLEVLGYEDTYINNFLSS